jgi:hypothetical protein
MVWADVAIDFMEGFPRMSVILTMVERFSQATHFIPLGHPYMATSVPREFFNAVVKLHEIPSSIVSDCDPVFTSNFWKDLFSLAGVKLCMSLAFHPQSDRQAEATNKIIMMYI